MPPITKAIFFLGLALTILPSAGPFKVAAAAATVTAAGRAQDLCHLGSFELDGDLYCRSVRGIQYANISTQGSYRGIVSMNADGSCTSSERSYKGPLAPLNEEVSVHFRGPLNLKQFAVYVPQWSDGIVEPNPWPRRRVPVHTAYVPSPGYVLERLMGQVVEAEVDGPQVTLFKDFLSIIDTSSEESSTSGSASTSATPSRLPGWLTAILTEKVAACLDDWIDKASNMMDSLSPSTAAGSDARAPIKTTAEIVGKLMSWVNNWFGNSSSSPAVSTHASTKKPADSAVDTCPSTESAAPTYDPRPYKRLSFYDAASQTMDNLVFLGNHGGQGGSGAIDSHFGSSVSYVSADGTEGAPSPQVLADTTIPCNAEVIIMMGTKCKLGSCGFVRPGSSAYHGFGGADKVFLMEFSMPNDEKAGFDGDVPAIWLPNAQIPRTIQYGPDHCSCWASGCGEFDIVEALSRGSLFLKSALHVGDTPDNNTGSGSVADYIARPTDPDHPMNSPCGSTPRPRRSISWSSRAMRSSRRC